MSRSSAALLQTDAAFSAVGDRVRRAILERLQEGEKSAGDIAAAFDISWPAISRHLRLLKEADLIVERRSGRTRLYRLNRPALRRISDWVATFDALWNDNLTSLKRLVEADDASRKDTR
jgi:DNA-binding transcriptional ArsR family regulator